MNDALRPDPDALLRQLQAEDARARRGRLCIFLGMSAGVGKTYAMLEAGERARIEGVDAVIGVVETHGRFETGAMVDSLPLMPRQKLEHRGVTLQEMDLDGILARKPKLVLVDELAHSNSPGSRHPKRWQDVLELLGAGIDVHTTLNVQHLESRKESVEKIQGIPVRETVPDSLLERADEIKLIDISPEALLKRLAEGKVYLGEKATRAAENFFKHEALTALREMALRVTAERVDRELGEIRRQQAGGPQWNARERLMVAVDDSPGAEALLRAARRQAAALGAPWLAVYVSSGEGQRPAGALRQNLRMAEDLGAEVITTADVDLASGLGRVARERNVTQLLIGRPSRSFLGTLSRGGSLLARLSREAGDFDLHVIRAVQGQRGQGAGSFFSARATWIDYWYMLWIVGALGLAGWPVEKLLGYRSVGIVFLAALLALSVFFSAGPLTLAAVLSAAVWDFFFIPPRFTWYISQAEDLLLVVAYFITAFSGGVLAWRLRRSRSILQEREARTQLLFDVSSILNAPGSHPDRFSKLAQRLESALGLEVTLHLCGPDGTLDPQGFGATHQSLAEKEVAVADWAVKTGQAAGWSTANLPQTGRLMLPLLGAESPGPLGLLVCKPVAMKTLAFEQERLLQAAAQQLAHTLERALLQREAREGELLKQSERLHQALLDSISHELRTPLTALMGSAAALRSAGEADRAKLLDEIATAGGLLDRSVGNLLDLSRLNAGRLQLALDWQDPGELLRLNIHALQPLLREHPVELAPTKDLPLLLLDHRLFEHAFANLLLNAAAHSPAGSPIQVSVEAEADWVVLRVEDHGPGISLSALPHVFERFYRAPGEKAGGTGLGLSIVQAIVLAHGGKVEAANAPSGGAVFTLRLKVPPAPPPAALLEEGAER